MIREVKYGRSRAWLTYLVDVLYKGFQMIPDDYKEEVLITWIPHNPDEERRFNLSKGLALNLARRLGIEADEVLIKVKPTRRQASLSLKERLENLKGAFEVRREVEAKRILIVDDVVTTGTTLLEAGKPLKGEGYDLLALTLAFRL